MLVSDFKKYNIINFTPSEITHTGAALQDVQKESVIALQKFREYIRRRVGLIVNGITSGNHKAPAHPEGWAIDCFLFPEDGQFNIHQIFKGALNAGFVAIGIYYNQKQHSLHLEVSNKHRQDFAWWLGIKNPQLNINSWQWYSLLRDPSKVDIS